VLKNKKVLRKMNVKPKFFKVMKQKIFTLIMMLALVIVTSSAFAQGTNVTPFPGSTYSYALTGIYVQSAGTAAIAITGSDVTIQNVEGSGVAYAGPEAVPATTSFTLNFDIAYDLDATGTRTLTVTVADGAATGGCTNFIELQIVIQPLPAIDLAISASPTGAYCQNINSTPLTNNTPASTGATLNTITFTVDPNITNPPGGGYHWDYTIALTNAANHALNPLTGYDIVYTGTGSYAPATGLVTGASGTANETFAVSFTTTTGIAPQTITGTISSASITTTVGSIVYTGTTSVDTDHTDVNTMPSIGSF
jgi:hypothetical protein